MKHYNIDPINSLGADFNIIYGERSNGKSYQLKHKMGVIKYLETGSKFILVRRFRDELTTDKIEKYFDDVDVEKLTDGKYNIISVYRKSIYLSNMDMETFKVTRGEKIGYAISLSQEQNYAGSSFLDVNDIIFEEFMSRGAYLYNEPSKLMNLYATIDRKRKTTRLWLVGNSISRVCPYIYEWGLTDVFKRLKEGEMDVVNIKSSDDDIVKLAIEYCEPTGVSSHTIGLNKEMINTGAWDSRPQPHLPKKLNCYKRLYRFIFSYQNFTFICELLADKETNYLCWYIYPYYKKIKDNILVITDRIDPSPLYQRDIYNITINNPLLKNILSTFREDKIFYATDLCGTDFKQVIDFTIRR